MKIFRTVFILVIIVVITLFGTAYSKPEADIELIETEKSNLIQEFDSALNLVSKNKSSSDKLQISYENLKKEIGTFNDSDFLIILKDDDISPLTKNLLLQMSDEINGGKGISSSKAFEALLEKDILDESSRVSLINSIKADTDGIKNKLAEIAQSESGSAVYRSMVKLQQSDASMALEVSDKILENSSHYNEDNIRAAITVKSNYYKELSMVDSKKDIEKEKSEFIDFCTSQYKKASDDKLKDSAVFSLMNIRDYDAVKAIILDPTIDEELKVACVSRNPKTFIDVINGNPTKEDVEFILDCMEIYPLKELAEPMREKLISNSDFYSHRLVSMVEFLAAGGAKSDTSRFEGTPNSNWIK
ncbi:MAG: hypothetical protein J6B22_05245 [Clostridia bacterium]|nr:hypothetical protein [Clostridia bacterium]